MTSKTSITTSLPYCLYRIDTRLFKVPDGNETKIRFTKVQTTPNRRTSSSKNTETIRDRWGIDAHSDVEILTDLVFTELTDAETFALKLINDFVQRYRYIDRDAVHLVPISTEDLFGFNMISEGHGAALISLAGGITFADPLKTHEISNQIEESIKQFTEIPLYEEMLLNSHQYLYQLDYRHSILEVVIALEVVISRFVLNKCKEKGISELDAKNFIQDIGLTGNIKVTVKLLLNVSILPADEVFEKCKSAITLRNKIVHEGRKDIGRTDAKNALDNIQALIEFLLPHSR